MIFKAEDIAAIQTLGYTPDEARFLYLVAVHSGYFVPRQFLAFSGTKWGKRSNKLVSKLESRGHATWREYDRTGSVYHLFSKTLYRYIGKEDIRNRRRHSVEFIRTRLLLLDFILENLGVQYFETERDKLAYFCEELGLDRNALPRKTYEGRPQSEPTLRYFVDKFPLFLEENSTGIGSESSSDVVRFARRPIPPATTPTTTAEMPGLTTAAASASLHALRPCSTRPSLKSIDGALLTFSYVDPGQATLAGFANHLHAYGPLLRKLDQFAFIYIANSPIHFQAAERCFTTLIGSPSETNVSSEILRYFQLRHAWEDKRYGSFSASDIEWLKEANERFRGQRFEDFYGAWTAGTLGENAFERQFGKASQHRDVTFRTYLVQSVRSGRNRFPDDRDGALHPPASREASPLASPLR